MKPWGEKVEQYKSGDELTSVYNFSYEIGISRWYLNVIIVRDEVVHAYREKK